MQLQRGVCALQSSSLLHGLVLATSSALEWDKMDSHIIIPEVDIMYTDDYFIIEMNV